MNTRPIDLILTAARLSLQTVLVLLAPVVRVICGAAVLLGAFVCVVFEASTAGPKFPLLDVLVLMTGFSAFALAYHALLAQLQR